MEILTLKTPEILKQTSAPAERLYAIGNIKLLKEKNLIAIVGSRRASEYGLRNAHRISKSLAEAGCVIVSGLALGVDAASHRGALAAGEGRTIAVLGSAINNFQPRTNEALARKILENDGLIISEYEEGSPTYAPNFVFRNRIIAGLSKATIVIEAAEKSGALITANLAVEYNRLVYALPGDVDRLNSKGTNRLISSGAVCLSDPSIILEDLGLEKEKQIRLPLNDQEKEIVVEISNQEMNFDKIVNQVKISPSKLLAILLSLELKGVIRKDEEGRYYLNK
ncbi:MAG: DNA-processing protein DprA [bacterium]